MEPNTLKVSSNARCLSGPRLCGGERRPLMAACETVKLSGKIDMLKSTLLLVSLASFGITFLPGQNHVTSRTSTSAPLSQTASKNRLVPTAASEARAKQIYGYDCAICHGTNGDGKTGADSQLGLNAEDLTSPATLAASQTRSCSKSLRMARAKCQEKANV